MSKTGLLFLFLLILAPAVYAQSEPDQDLPSPKVAFLKSLIMPGWGHYYVDHQHWTRGQYQLAAEGVLWLSYLGLSIHANNLRHNWYTFARTEAGVTVSGRSRSFQLAVGDFNNLQTYNDYQERSRNWGQILDNTPANQWNWNAESSRMQYNDMRDRFEHINEQLPALIGLMVLNRVISAVSAYNRARKKQPSAVTSSLSITPYSGTRGLVANIEVGF